MADATNDVEIELQCDHCGKTTKKSLVWAEDHSEVACDCGNMIPVDVHKYRKELAKAESSADGFQGLLEKLGE
jgi:hypothetical protein